MPCRPEDWSVKKRFYEHEGKEIDSGWKKWESHDAWIAQQLRDGRTGEEIVKEIPGLLTRLAYRTASARTLLQDSTVAIGTAMFERDRKAGRTGADIREEYIKRLKVGDDGLRQIVIRRLQAKKNIKKPRSGKRVRQQEAKLARQARNVPPELLENIHAKAIYEAERTAEERATEYHLDWLEKGAQQGKTWHEYAKEGIRFDRYDVASGIMCLGDHAVFEEREGGEDRAYHPLEAQHLEMKAVYLPLGSEVLLVGLTSEAGVRDIDWILQAIAALSTESFISRESNESTAWMHEMIGTCRGGITESEIDDILKGTRWSESGSEKRR